MTKAAFTVTELKRIQTFYESVGESVGCVEKSPDGTVRVLTKSDLADARSARELERNPLDRVLRQ